MKFGLQVLSTLQLRFEQNYLNIWNEVNNFFFELRPQLLPNQL